MKMNQQMNQQFQVEFNAGEYTTGLTTVRQLARIMIDGCRVDGECVCEMFFVLDGKRINMEFAVTSVDGVQYARQWKPRFNFSKWLIGKIA